MKELQSEQPLSLDASEEAHNDCVAYVGHQWASREPSQQREEGYLLWLYTPPKQRSKGAVMKL